MDNPNNLTGWTADQWGLVNGAVASEVNKVSVAGAFLPCYGPLKNTAEVVRKQNIYEGRRGEERDGGALSVEPLMVDDVETHRLWTASIYVHLKQQQIAQEQLEDAMLVFRRAANLLARAEDAIVFNGLPHADPSRGELDLIHVPSLCRITGGEHAPGLVAAGRPAASKDSAPENVKPPYGTNLVAAVAAAISELETYGHLGPFACVMGMKAFVAAQTPNDGSLVLPSDRIEPLLGMKILRSGTLEPGQIVVVSLAGDPIDLVVATSPTVQFLYLTDEARYVFRVYERFVLRVKERHAVASFQLGDDKPTK